MDAKLEQYAELPRRRHLGTPPWLAKAQVGRSMEPVVASTLSCHATEGLVGVPPVPLPNDFLEHRTNLMPSCSVERRETSLREPTEATFIPHVRGSAATLERRGATTLEARMDDLF